MNLNLNIVEKCHSIASWETGKPMIENKTQDILASVASVLRNVGFQWPRYFSHSVKTTTAQFTPDLDYLNCGATRHKDKTV